MKKIFISYCHEDETWKDKVNKHLKVLQMEGISRSRDDRQIPVGTDWEKKIFTMIDTAGAFILLVTAGFLASGYIRDKEVPRILERVEKQGVPVFPVIVKPCLWNQSEWLKRFQLFPKDGKPLSMGNKNKVDENLALLAGEICRVFGGAPVREEELPGPLPGRLGKTVMLTGFPRRQVNLLGREKELAELEKIIAGSDRVLLVNGTGGIGKTEVCKRFFMDRYDRYQYAGWIDMVGSVKESLVYAGDPQVMGGKEGDSQEERFDILQAFLLRLEGSALLVLDNLEDPEDPDLDFFKGLPKGVRVLATSRNVIEGFAEYPLEVLSAGCCRELFYLFYKGVPDDGAVDRVVELCGSHTLTVELLARTCWQAHLPVKSLVKLLEKKGFNLGEAIREPVGLFWHEDKSRKLFFRHLQTVFDLSKLGREEKNLAANISVLPAMYIPADDLSRWLGLETRGGLNGLVDRGWLRRDREFNIYMHPVIREVVREKTKPNGKTCGKLIGSLTRELNIGPGENPLEKKGLAIHAREVLVHITDKTNATATLANNLSTIYRALGRQDQALEYQLKAMEIREQVLEKNHPDLATSYNNLSTIYQALGRMDQALEYQLKAMEIREQVLEKNHPSLATSYNNLSAIYKTLGQLDQALEFQLKATEIYETVLEKNHPSLATSYNNLSTIYQDLGRLDQALPYCQKAVAILEFNFPHGHPNLDMMRSNLEEIKRVKSEG